MMEFRVPRRGQRLASGFERPTFNLPTNFTLLTRCTRGVDIIRKRSFGRLVPVESFSIYWANDVGRRNELQKHGEAHQLHATAIAGNRFPNASVVVVPDTVVA